MNEISSILSVPEQDQVRAAMELMQQALARRVGTHLYHLEIERSGDDLRQLTAEAVRMALADAVHDPAFWFPGGVFRISAMGEEELCAELDDWDVEIIGAAGDPELLIRSPIRFRQPEKRPSSGEAARAVWRAAVDVFDRNAPGGPVLHHGWTFAAREWWLQINVSPQPVDGFAGQTAVVECDRVVVATVDPRGGLLAAGADVDLATIVRAVQAA